eukprot:COSAG01_NODE_496_length_16290_cov_48.639244_13_plen_202_part_00
MSAQSCRWCQGTPRTQHQTPLAVLPSGLPERERLTPRRRWSAMTATFPAGALPHTAWQLVALLTTNRAPPFTCTSPRPRPGPSTTSTSAATARSCGSGSHKRQSEGIPSCGRKPGVLGVHCAALRPREGWVTCRWQGVGGTARCGLGLMVVAALQWQCTRQWQAVPRCPAISVARSPNARRCCQSQRAQQAAHHLTPCWRG